jgi:hypothetical protein
MRFTVSEGILAETTKCEMDFVCLSGKIDHLCKIERAIGSNPILLLLQGETPICHYNCMFGSRFICACPTRREIYKRYRI